MHNFNPLNAKLNPICHLLALLGARHILHVSRIRVKVYSCLKTALHIRRNDLSNNIMSEQVHFRSLDITSIALKIELTNLLCDFDHASSLICGNKMPTRCNRGFYCRSYCLLNTFRAPLCHYGHSGARNMLSKQ